MGSGRDGRLSRRWHRRSSISPKAAPGAWISIWRNFSIRVNHDKLMGQIAKRVEDKRLLKLIRVFLNAGVMENGLVSPSVEGTPQGGPLSPLLSNLVLDELDRAQRAPLERRGHRFVRYADDCNMYYSFSWRAIRRRFRETPNATARWLNFVRAVSTEGFGRPNPDFSSESAGRSVW
jgi:hypothetical protein